MTVAFVKIRGFAGVLRNNALHRAVVLWREAFVVKGKKRSRMRGGASRSRSPLRNQYNLMHGNYTRESPEIRTHVRELI